MSLSEYEHLKTIQFTIFSGVLKLCICYFILRSYNRWLKGAYSRTVTCMTSLFGCDKNRITVD